MGGRWGSVLLGRLTGQGAASRATPRANLSDHAQDWDKLRRRSRNSAGVYNRLTREEAGGPFRRLAGALLAADLEAARVWMDEELRGRDAQRQKRVLALLPELGEAQARPMVSLLVRLVGDTAGNSGLRAQAASALAGIRFAPDAETWRVLEVARRGDPQLRRAGNWAWCELGGAEDLGLVKVPAGEFLMGSKEGEGDSDEQPQHLLYLPTFYIGKGPVTLAMIEEFHSAVPDEFFFLLKDDLDRQLDRKTSDHPVVDIDSHIALEYAQAQGFTLPSEAEWEKAARGPDGRVYPWGNEWRPGCANTAEHWSRGGILARRRLSPGLWETTPVGTFSPQGDSPYGCQDMAGNVWEWTRSAKRSYPYDPTDGREDLEDPTDSPRVLRGGAYFSGASNVRCAVRGRSGPSFRDWDVGFRVVLLPFFSDL
jgi:formylglycine-generating enzyme required for sulfatase activity